MPVFAFTHSDHLKNPGRCENRALIWDELAEELSASVEVQSKDKKADAGFISLARYEATRRQAKFVEAVTAIGLDVDERCPDLPVLERRLRALGWSAIVYETISSTEEHRKVRILIEMSSTLERGDSDLPQFKKRLSAVQKAASSLLGVVPDSQCVGDVARIFYRPCHLPNQKMYFKRFTGECADTDLLERLGQIGKIDQQATAEMAGLVTPERQNSNGNWELDECPYADCHSDPKGARGGAFVGEHYAIHCDHNTCGHDETTSGYNTRSFLYRMVMQGTIKLSDIVEEREPTVQEIVEAKEPFGLMAQAEWLLAETGENLRYNEFSLLPELWKGEQKRPLTDADEMLLRQMWPIAFADEPAPSSEEMHRALIALGQKFRAYHPVREYLDGLKWDGTARLDTWFIDACGAEDRPDVRAYGAKFLVGAVKRIYEPGCQFDQILILHGSQGAKKSSVVRALVPDREWFSDSVELGVNSKQAIEQLAGRWIVEVAELVGNSKREVDQIKHMVTRREDRARLAYAKNITLHVRESVMFGTTNDDEILRDPTGSRRFWIVKVNRCDPAWVEENRDQLFAEAKERMLTEKLWIDEEDSEAYAAMQERHAEFADNGPYYDLLREKIKDTGPLWIHSKHVWEMIGVDQDNIKQATNVHKNNLKKAMMALGFEKKVIRVVEGDEVKRLNAYIRKPLEMTTKDVPQLRKEKADSGEEIFVLYENKAKKDLTRKP